jgi:hypothetical protein
MRLNNRFLAMGICRLFGAAGCFVLTAGFYTLFHQRFGVAARSLADIGHAGPRVWIFLAVAMLLGMVGTVFGQGFGMHVPIVSDRLALSINVAWHCVANGSMAWLCLSGTLVGLALRNQELLRQFAEREGPKFLFGTVGVATVGSLGIAVVMMYSLSLRRRGQDDRADVVAATAHLPVGPILGMIQALVWHTPLLGGVVTGLLFSITVPVFSAGMWERDQAMRFRSPTAG